MKDPDGLNARQRLFVNAYRLEPNALQAAIAAGYSNKTARTIGPRLLLNVAIRTVLERAERITAEKVQISHEWVIERLIQNHERAMQAEAVMKFDPASKAMVETGEYVYNGSVANRALELIGKHLGTFPERVVVDDPKGLPRERVAEKVKELRRTLKLA